VLRFWTAVVSHQRLGTGFAALGAIAIVGYFVLPEAASIACYLLVSTMAMVAVPLGVARYRPSSLSPWIALGLAQAIFLLADALRYGPQLASGAEPPFPAIADIVYLIGYPVLALGMVMFIRLRQPRYRLTAGLDALIVGIAGVLILWLTVIDGVVHDNSAPLVERVVTVAYPIGDALILAVGAYLLLSGRSGRRALYLLVASLLALLGADVVFAVPGDVEMASTMSNALWLSSYLLFGLAALDPSMRELTEPSETAVAPEGRGRLILIGIAITVLPAFAVYERFFMDHQDLAVTGIAGVVVIGAILLRMRELGAVLGRSERRYASLLANASDAFAIVQADGRFKYASPASDRVLGYQPGATVGRSLFEFLQPGSVTSAAASLRHVAALNGSQAELELPIQRGDGEWRWMSMVATNRTDDPIVNGIVLNYRDVTERRESRRRLDVQAQVLAEVQHAVFVTDTAGRITYWNRAAEDLLGWTADQAVGQAISELRLTRDATSTDVLAMLDHSGGRGGGELELRRRDGSDLTALVTSSALADEDGRLRGVILVAVDISDRKRLEERLQQQAFSDALTGLANRALFVDRIDHVLGRRRRDPDGAPLAVLFLDLDDFKTVNDSMGHGVGDELLVGLARRLTAALRPSDTAARLGGDEFAILLDGGGTTEAEAVARRLLSDLAEPIRVGGHEVHMSASIGIAVPPRGVLYTAQELLRDADLAMYRAKARFPGGYAIYHSSMHEAAMRRLELKADLQRAIEDDQLALEFQPIIRLRDHAAVGAEALLRWTHDGRGPVAVAEIMALAEAAGLTMPLAGWVLEHACRQARQWLSGRPHAVADRMPFVCVNASARELLDPLYPDLVTAALARSGLAPELLTIEITESDLMQESEAAVEVLSRLKGLGVGLAIDDFGTGYSSLAYLARFPLDVLKIGRTFVAASGSGNDGAIARAIVELARSLSMSVVAEGIENARDLSMMESLGVEFGQGFHLGRPAKAEVTAKFFTTAAAERPRQRRAGNPAAVKVAPAEA
jgi:diguanylate cyclase (GGDEF)-like protein/PAS domain S-box-containing protein